MPKKANSAVGVAILAMAAITKLTQSERIAAFVDRSTVTQRAFSEMGKLLSAISADLKPKETIYAVMRKAGIKDGTTSNASYAAKVFELVTDGILKESVYDTFTFQDCLAINRVIGPKSAKRMSKEDVAVIVQAVPDFETELACIFEHGVTLEEKAKNDELIAAANAEPEPAAPAAPAATESKGTAPAPVADKAAPAPVANAAAAVAPETGKVVEMPKSKPTAETLNRLLDSFEEQFLELTVDDQILIGGRFLAIAETIFSFKDSVKVAA